MCVVRAVVRSMRRDSHQHRIGDKFRMHLILDSKVSRVTTVDHGECCGRRLARGRHCDLLALRMLAPASLRVLVLLLVLAAATRPCSPCCANPRHQLMRSESDSRRSARGLGCQCSRTIRWVRPTAPSPSARAPRPPSRPRLPNTGPAHILAHCTTPAPRARATRRACLASADASRRNKQNPPRSICPRDGSREHEPRTCAIAHRVPHCCAGACKLTHARGLRRGDQSGRSLHGTTTTT